MCIRDRPWAARSATTCARTKLASSGSSSPATSRTASSSITTTWGNASRKKPLIRTVTSTRGRPSSSRGIGARPVTRRDASSHTGRTPRSASTSATSSPEVRMALVPQIDRPTERGQSPVSAR